MGAKADDVDLSHSGRKIAKKPRESKAGRIGSPMGGNMDCTMVAGAPVLPVGTLLTRGRLLIGDDSRGDTGWRIF
jgi:hypothetical protein